VGLKVDFWDLVVSQVNFGKSVAENTDPVFFEHGANRASDRTAGRLAKHDTTFKTRATCPQ
jgi:hypothetical protein